MLCLVETKKVSHSEHGSDDSVIRLPDLDGGSVKLKQSTLGTYIRALRTQNRMTQAQLAQKLGVTDKAVSKWERDLSYPDMALFPKLADILGVTANDLLRESLDESRPSRLLQILSMSRDIRTPLHIIIGSANLAGIHRDDPKLLQHYLDSIRVSGEYLLKMIDRLMEVAEQDQNSRQPYFQTDIQELGEYLNREEDASTDPVPDYDFSEKRILVAEDIRMNREIAAEILKQTGAETEFAEDGAVCVQMVEAAPAGYYDLILMDITMPGMDGLEATRRIRALEDKEKSQIPIIAVSANVYEKDRKEAMDAGMDAFAEKPIFIDRLFKTIKQHLR